MNKAKDLYRIASVTHKKGADMDEWPDDLRGVREFPSVTASV